MPFRSEKDVFASNSRRPVFWWLARWKITASLHESSGRDAACALSATWQRLLTATSNKDTGAEDRFLYSRFLMGLILLNNKLAGSKHLIVSSSAPPRGSASRS